MTFTTTQVIEATRGRLLSGAERLFLGVSTDTRTMQDGEIFFAIKGEKFNGNDFLHEALKKGAGVVTNISDFKTLTPDANGEKQKCIIYVTDTLKALQDLAHFVRISRNLPVTAVTGSNGKTTTKEMIVTILSQHFKVLKNEGNFNNHIGVPLTLLKLLPEHEQIILEFGMNAPGEIRRLREIALPHAGVITNIGMAHIGNFESVEAVRDAKLELLEDLDRAIINRDDKLLMSGVHDFRGNLTTFGLHQEALVRAKDIRLNQKGSAFTVSLKEGKDIHVKLNVQGKFNIYNALAAAALCHTYGINEESISRGLRHYRGFPMRYEIIQKSGVTIINDAYNANPSSVEEAINAMTMFKGKGRLIALLGDMLELGHFSEEAHRAVGKKLSQSGVDLFVAVGSLMSIAVETANGMETKKFDTPLEAGKYLGKRLQNGDILLVKGSRSMKMETALKESLNAL